MNSNFLVIALCAALLLAVGLLLFGVGRIIYGIAHYYLFERKSMRRFEHHEFGVFTSDESEETLWAATVQRGGRKIPIVVGGTKNSPDQQLLQQTQSILTEFAALESRAAEFLRSRDPGLRGIPLDFYLLVVADEQHPKNFAFEFIDASDDRVWRAEFVDGEPKETGLDD